jgi:NADH:ubiquinone oxidoreductase subunit 6 (subunit J)
VIYLISALMVGFSFGAVISYRLRETVIFYWLASICLGVLFLFYGAEYLALAEWLGSGLLATLILFYATLFGEYGETTVLKGKAPWHRELLAVFSGAVATLSLFYGLKEGHNVMDFAVFDSSGTLIRKIGVAMIEHYWFAIVVFILSFFLAVVGIGVVGRTDKGAE